MKVVILDSAQADLHALRRYMVKNFSASTWQTTYNKLKTAIRNLAEFPYMGSIPPELEAVNLTQYRQLLSGMNRIIYEVRGDTVYVHIIADTRRNMQSLLIDRLVR
jgi:toxin ParE1/3/4